MKQDIEIIRGTSNAFMIEVTDDNGDLHTLADGEQIIFGVKKRPSDLEYTLKKTVTKCTGGVCVVELDPEDTVDVPFGKYFYDVGLQSGKDYFSIIEPSVFHIKPNVTKWGDGA